MVNISGKFHLNPPAKYRDIVSHDIAVNRQTMDKKTAALTTQYKVPTIFWYYNSRTSKEPKFAFSRKNSRRKFTA